MGKNGATLPIGVELLRSMYRHSKRTFCFVRILFLMKSLRQITLVIWFHHNTEKIIRRAYAVRMSTAFGTFNSHEKAPL